jgi:hypothetical protein
METAVSQNALSGAIEASNLGFWYGFVIFTLITIHIALAIWVARDILHRTRNPWLQISLTALAIFAPIVGIAIYLALRPPEPLTEIIMHKLEAKLHLDTCPKCGAPSDPDHQYCHFCAHQLKITCPSSSCSKLINPDFHHCPYCQQKILSNQS